MITDVFVYSFIAVMAVGIAFIWLGDDEELIVLAPRGRAQARGVIVRDIGKYQKYHRGDLVRWKPVDAEMIIVDDWSKGDRTNDRHVYWFPRAIKNATPRCMIVNTCHIAVMKHNVDFSLAGRNDESWVDKFRV